MVVWITDKGFDTSAGFGGSFGPLYGRPRPHGRIRAAGYITRPDRGRARMQRGEREAALRQHVVGGADHAKLEDEGRRSAVWRADTRGEPR